MLDLTGFGAAIVVGGAALLGLFAHFRSHSDKFRDDNRERVDALRTRMGNNLVLEFLTKFLPQIDGLLKKSQPFLQVRQKLIMAMTRNEPIEKALQDIRDVADKFPPTAAESRKLKELADQLLASVKKQEDVTKAYTDGYEQENRAADQILKLALVLIGIGVLAIGASALYASNPGDTGWLTSVALLALFLVVAGVFLGMNGFGNYQRASAAQTKFRKAVDAELYETATSSQSKL